MRSIDVILLCSPTIQIYTYLKESNLLNEDGNSKDDPDVKILWEGLEWKKEAMYYLQDVPNLYFPAFQPPNVTQFEQHFCKSL